MVRVARELGWTDIRIPASTAMERLDLEAIEAAQRPMDSVVSQLRAAAVSLGAVGDDGPVPAPSPRAIATPWRHSTIDPEPRGQVRDTMRLATTMFSGDRRYLLVVPALGLRPNGGAPTTIGVLTVSDGLMDLRADGPAPRPFVGAMAGAPDWPRTARSLMDAAEVAGMRRPGRSDPLDAVALQDLVDDRGRARGGSGAPALGPHDHDHTRDRGVPDRLPAAIGLPARGVDRCRRPGVPRRAARRRDVCALATSSAARERHLAVYVPGRRAQTLLRSLGLDGRARLRRQGTFPVAGTWSTRGNAHVGAFVNVTLRLDHSRDVREDGSARVSAVVLFENGAGTEPPSVLLGRPAGGHSGRMPRGNALRPRERRNLVAETSRPGRSRSSRDPGVDAVTGSIEVAGGGSTTLTVTYGVDDVVRVDGDERELTLRLLPQPTLAGVGHVVRIAMPEVRGSSRRHRSSNDGRTSQRSQGPERPDVDLVLRFSVSD